MAAFNALYLVGTLGFFVTVVYGAFYLHRWPLCVALLATSLLVGYALVGTVRLLLFSDLLTVEDAKLIAGMAPYVALGFLIGLPHPGGR